jgi:hypothetical protein
VGSNSTANISGALLRLRCYTASSQTPEQQDWGRPTTCWTSSWLLALSPLRSLHHQSQRKKFLDLRGHMGDQIHNKQCLDLRGHIGDQSQSKKRPWARSSARRHNENGMSRQWAKWRRRFACWAHNQNFRGSKPRSATVCVILGRNDIKSHDFYGLPCDGKGGDGDCVNGDSGWGLTQPVSTRGQCPLP